MSDPLKAFKHALLVNRVATHFRQAMEFNSPEALKQYLKEHPGADRSNHSVKHNGPAQAAPKGWDSKKDKAFGEAFKDYKKDIPHLKEIADAQLAGKLDPKTYAQLKSKIDPKLEGMDFKDAWAWVQEETSKPYMRTDEQSGAGNSEKQPTKALPKLQTWQDIVKDDSFKQLQGPRGDGGVTIEQERAHQEIDEDFIARGDYGQHALQKRILDHQDVQEYV